MPFRTRPKTYGQSIGVMKAVAFNVALINSVFFTSNAWAFGARDAEFHKQIQLCFNGDPPPCYGEVVVVHGERPSDPGIIIHTPFSLDKPTGTNGGGGRNSAEPEVIHIQQENEESPNLEFLNFEKEIKSEIITLAINVLILGEEVWSAIASDGPIILAKLALYSPDAH